MSFPFHALLLPNFTLQPAAFYLPFVRLFDEHRYVLHRSFRTMDRAKGEKTFQEETFDSWPEHEFENGQKKTRIGAGVGVHKDRLGSEYGDGHGTRHGSES